MRRPLPRMLMSTPVCLSLLLSGCGGISLWPFGGDKSPEQSRIPPNATAYECTAGKRFYVRYLDSGSAAWVIMPEREVRLDKVASASGTRYSNGIAVLEINGDEATLTDGPTVSFTGCKTARK